MVNEDETLKIFGEKLGLIQKQLDELKQKRQLTLKRIQAANLCEFFDEGDTKETTWQDENNI